MAAAGEGRTMTSLKFWDGFQWIEIGSVPGPQGIQGVQGIQGIQGPTGPTAVVAQPGTPSNTNVLWVDTDDPDTSPYTVEAVHGHPSSCCPYCCRDC